MEVEENEIPDVIKKIKNREIYGINVTLPYKKKIIPFLDRLINDAEKTSSVNTVYLSPDNNLIGDNTDVFGMQAGYLKNLSHNNPKNQKVPYHWSWGCVPINYCCFTEIKYF